MSRHAVIVDVLRTAMGRTKEDGAFVETHPNELLGALFSGLIERNRLDPGTVDDVIIGCVGQVGEQSSTPGRGAWLGAGLPEHVPSVTIERKCGSSQQAVHFAAYGIMAGDYDIVITGGVESMSHVPMMSARLDRDPYGPSFHARYPEGMVTQGVAAELIADQWKLSREDMDAFALASHQRAESARPQFEKEILPIRTQKGGEPVVVDRDETIRANSTPERMAQLTPRFGTPEMVERFPHIRWSVTPGNASQFTDGAAVALIMSETCASRLGLKPRARLVAFDVIADDPRAMLTAPIPCTRRILRKSGLKIEAIDQYEVNEAFAAVPLAWQKEFGADGARLNPYGGAIALGHPLGASGARLMTTLVNGLETTKGRYGLQTMCEHGGMANATIIERL